MIFLQYCIHVFCIVNSSRCNMCNNDLVLVQNINFELANDTLLYIVQVWCVCIGSISVAAYNTNILPVSHIDQLVTMIYQAAMQYQVTSELCQREYLSLSHEGNQPPLYISYLYMYFSVPTCFVVLEPPCMDWCLLNIPQLKSCSIFLYRIGKHKSHRLHKIYYR